MSEPEHHLVEDEQLHGRRAVFADRDEAGAALAQMLDAYRGSDAIVLAVPAGGVPVAKAVAERLNLPLDLAVASKIPRPGNREAGYGAVAFDGTVLLDQAFIDQAGLDPQRVDDDVNATREKIEERLAWMRGDRRLPAVHGRTVIVIDDGLASGTTMLAALKAIRNQGAAHVIVAVPTAHAATLKRLAGYADRFYCANVRTESPFAVADAYRQWRDIEDAEAIEILGEFFHHRGE